MSRLVDISNKRFHSLVVLSLAGNDGHHLTWHCRCDCGTTFIARGSAIKSGNTKSCGCLVRQNMSRIGKTNGTHRLSGTLEYQSWNAMVQRCGNPKNNRFKYYGARGIAVCERWIESFENFLADMGHRPSPKHSIDRIENDGPYCPENCRWSTAVEQRRNRRPNGTALAA